MRYDSKKGALLKADYYMSSTSRMLPTMFDVPRVPINKKRNWILIEQDKIIANNICKRFSDNMFFESVS